MADSSHDTGQAAPATDRAMASDTSAPIARIDTSSSNRSRRSSSAAGRLRSASVRLLESNPPLGFLAATGEVMAKAPSLSELKNGSHGIVSRRRLSSSASQNPGGKERSSSAGTRSPPPGSPGRPLADSGAPQIPPIGFDATSSADQKQKGVARLRMEDSIEEDEDGLPANILGRGEMSNQTYEKPTIKRVAPQGSVDRRSRAMEVDENGLPAMLFGRGEMADQSYEGRPNRLSKQALVPPPADADALDAEADADEDEDEDLFPKPKRHSKNIKAMLGQAPPSGVSSDEEAPVGETKKPEPNEDGYYPNGYHFPAKKSTGEATIIGLKAFWNFCLTPLGFLILIYGLNVVAWGGMLFLLLCNASPAMCYVNGVYNCNDINAPRRIWIEIDSQILNALFCVTGFGLIPWRFRDFYYLIRFRCMHDENALRRLAGFHRGWFRLPGSDTLPVPEGPDAPLDDPSCDGKIDASDPRLPIPMSKAPNLPLTGVRASPTPLWKMDYVVLLFVANTFLQAVLSGFMWGLNRYNRPSWSTGLFVALACIVAAMAGLMQFQQGKRIKKVEGIPLETAEALQEAAASSGNSAVPDVEKTSAGGRRSGFFSRKGKANENEKKLEDGGNINPGTRGGAPEISTEIPTGSFSA